MIQVVCYRCGELVREDPRGDGTSHGLCWMCYIEEMMRLDEERRRAGHGRSGAAGRKAKTAHARYLERGMALGHQHDDWLEAGQRVLAGRTNVTNPLSADAPAEMSGRKRFNAQ